MRKQIAAANWKMNKTLSEGMSLLHDILSTTQTLGTDQHIIFAVPFPYLIPAQNAVSGKQNIAIAAQNCYHKTSGAYTGEVSVDMLESIDIQYVVIGHSERREYFAETNEMLAKKTTSAIINGLTVLFCVGETLQERESGSHFDIIKKD
jgi:triosephosphate isomerase